MPGTPTNGTGSPAAGTAPPQDDVRAPLRVAWLGALGESGGVPGLGGVIASQLVDNDVRLEIYAPDTFTLPRALRGHPNVSVVTVPMRWRWGRWYSRTPFRAFVTGTVSRALVARRLAARLRRRATEIDVVFQFSQLELFGLHGADVPPIVVHPCTSAAAERRWYWKERALALNGRALGDRLRYAAILAALSYRSVVQRRQARRPAVVVGPSSMFLAQLEADTRRGSRPTAVLRHAVELDRFSPDPGPRAAGRRLRILVLSRLSTRKGIELVVELSRRIEDLAPDVSIEIVGEGSLWSDYRPLLGALSPSTATYLGSRPDREVPSLLREVDLLLVPSHYEPGSLVVGEALASGVPVVASSAVGPTEVLSEPACWTFAAGDAVALEETVRRALPMLREQWTTCSSAARSAADTEFSPTVAGKHLTDVLQGASRSVPA